MADRQSQGLQIALIAAVMLDIVFGVVAYLMWRNFDEQKTVAATAVTAKSTADNNQKTAQDEAALLKEWMGFATIDSKDTVQKGKDADMTSFDDAFPKSYPPADRVYRKVVKTLYDTVKDRDKTIADEQKKRADAELQATTLLAESAAKLKAEQDNTTKEREERDKQKEGFKTELDLVRAETAKLAAEKKDALATAATQAAQLQGTVDATNAKLGDTRKRLAEAVHHLEETQRETFEVPPGKVLFVNQAQGTVYINLGEADSLRPLIKFTVYDAKTSDVSQGGKKATIEVTKLTGPHQAEAHILDSSYGNPVLSGDVIYTPLWAPGQRKHFALVGLMDVRGDKRGDLDLVRNLIAANGGIVDSYRDMDSRGRPGANKRVGTMTGDTNYLIIGTEPDPTTASSADIADFTAMDALADRDLVKKMKLKDFLEKIGWRPETTIQRFVPGFGTPDFQPRLPAGAKPLGSGSGSPPSKSRQPQSGATGTY